MPTKYGLGKGLDALLPLKTEELHVFRDMMGNGSETFLPLNKLTANPDQPRRHFDDTALSELAASIKTHGVIQPVIVEKAHGDGYVIVAGERRCRAAKLAGLSEVPAIVREYSDEKRLAVALIENIQRADLNPIEEASAYKRLMEIGSLSQDEAAAKVGKSRSTLANILRLLKLPPLMQTALEEGSITAGHARAVLSLEDAADKELLFNEVVAGGLSVREAERRSAQIAAGQRTPDTANVSVGLEEEAGDTGLLFAASAAINKSVKQASAKRRDPDLDALEQRFIDALGTKVTIDGDFTHGTLKIDFYSMEDLDALLLRLAV